MGMRIPRSLRKFPYVMCLGRFEPVHIQQLASMLTMNIYPLENAAKTMCAEIAACKKDVMKDWYVLITMCIPWGRRKMRSIVHKYYLAVSSKYP